MGFRGGCIWVLVGGEVTLARGWGGGGRYGYPSEQGRSISASSGSDVRRRRCYIFKGDDG